MNNDHYVWCLLSSTAILFTCDQWRFKRDSAEVHSHSESCVSPMSYVILMRFYMVNGAVYVKTISTSENSCQSLYRTYRLTNILNEDTKTFKWGYNSSVCCIITYALSRPWAFIFWNFSCNRMCRPWALNSLVLIVLSALIDHGLWFLVKI